MAYMNQEKKAKIAAALKPAVPAGWKWSLRCDGGSICLTIASAPVDLIAHINETARAKRERNGGQDSAGHCRVNHYYPEHFFTGDLLETFRQIIAAMNTGNYDRSDIMTDYFDVGHYVDVQVGRWDRPFVCTAATVAA